MLAGFTHARLLDDKLSFLVGARHDHYDHYKIETIARTVGGPLTVVQDGASGTTYSAGAIYYLGPVGLYANWSKNFDPIGPGRNPSLSGVPFGPATGKGLETGLRFSSKDGKYYATASYYDSKSQDRITGTKIGFITELSTDLHRRATAKLFHTLAPPGLEENVCLVVMGSEGRHEQILKTDQDNGLIFAPDDGDDVEQLRARFLPFARRVNVVLDLCGFPLCTGGVMASNPKWCLSLAEWRGCFAEWMSAASAGDLLNSTIFFDFRPLAGDWALADRLQDAGNVGSILRSAAAFGVGQVLALQGTAALWSPKVLRAGMGAHFGLRLVEGLQPDDLAALQVPLVGTSLATDQLLHQAALPRPCAWVLGNEGQGVQAALLARCALQVRIPQPGGEESLNVAAAAAVCFYESQRRTWTG